MEIRRPHIDPELLSAFKTARYQVEEPAITINIGEKNLAVDQLLANHRRTTWAFITPYNPQSKVIPNAENEARFEDFKKDVEGFFTFYGQGGGQENEWPAEKSVLILGIAIHEAKKLARKYMQDAIVYGVLDKQAKIIITKQK